MPAEVSGSMFSYVPPENPCGSIQQSTYFPRDAVTTLIRILSDHDRICRGAEAAMGRPFTKKFRDQLGKIRCNFYAQVGTYLFQAAKFDPNTGRPRCPDKCVRRVRVEARRSRRVPCPDESP